MAGQPVVEMPRRVLVVDDNADYGALVKEVLQNDGCIVEVLNRPCDAIEAAKAAQPIERVFLDLNFPSQESGLSAFQKIRALLPDVPITIVSGHIDEKFTAAASRFGFDLLRKQDGVEALRGKMRKVSA